MTAAIIFFCLAGFVAGWFLHSVVNFLLANDTTDTEDMMLDAYAAHRLNGDALE